jgi:hypothetical protein
LRTSTALEIPVLEATKVEVRSSAGLLEPGVVGLFRPILLLPEGFVERLTPSQVEAVVAHELCHVRRHDNLFAAIHMLVEAMFWSPLVCVSGVAGVASDPDPNVAANARASVASAAAALGSRSRRIGRSAGRPKHGVTAHSGIAGSRAGFLDRPQPFTRLANLLSRPAELIRRG